MSKQMKISEIKDKKTLDIIEPFKKIFKLNPNIRVTIKKVKHTNWNEVIFNA